MKLLAPGPASRVPPLDVTRAPSSPGRDLVPVRREVRRDYATTILAETAGLPPRGSLLDLLA